jgi:hypothetical protein
MAKIPSVPSVGRQVTAIVWKAARRRERAELTRCWAKACDQREKARSSAAAILSLAMPPKISTNRPVTAPRRR